MLKLTVITLIIVFYLINCTDSNSQLTVTPPMIANSTEQESPPIEPCYPIPSPAQLAWQDAELVMFLHFGMNTFTNREWGEGTEPTDIFNPTRLDANQWVSIAKEVGFEYLILTAKHHDGFCLWPSQYTSHSIAHSPYKNGQGNIVKEFSDACHSQGAKFGFYLSPWDRHDPSFGSEAYNIYFRNQLQELVTGYGDVSEVWFDGANGDSTRHQNYAWDLFFSTIRHYQPEAVMAVCGPDVRWIGNETGLGNETEWCMQPQSLSAQNATWGGPVWYPSECDVSIRPGWFYHDAENSQIKSVDTLIKIYFQSVGRNSNLLLNVPPNTEGLISEWDIARLREWRQRLNQIFRTDIFRNRPIAASCTRENSTHYAPENCLDGNRKTFWAAPKDSLTAEFIINLDKEEQLNIVRLEEAIQYGQRIKSFKLLYADNSGSWIQCAQGTTIGRSRIMTFDPVSAMKFKIILEGSSAAPTIRTINGFYSSLL